MNEHTAVAGKAAAIDNQNARAEQEDRLLEALSRFEALAASTAVEFGRIDLALNRVNDRQLKQAACERLQAQLTRTSIRD